MRLHSFHGGLSLPGHKAEAASRPIVVCPLPAVLVVPLHQHMGDSAEAVVNVGDSVARGQLIGRATARMSANVHAPAAGLIEAIELHNVAHPSALPALCIRIRCAAEQTTLTLPPLAVWADIAPELLLQRIADAGIVGLGGAGFPTAAKLGVDRRLLILNGAECEPWIACDDRLLQERAAEVITGGRLLRRICGAERVILAIEDAMVDALAAVRLALTADDDIELVAVPTVYPQGGERQLIRVLSGREVPSGGLPRDIGVLVHNVATAAACWRAVMFGESLTRRIVSVTGPGIVNPGNFEVAFGTPIQHVIAHAGGYSAAASRLLHGGPLMGFALPHDDLPISKSSNCILVLTDKELRSGGDQMPCIRCGDCAEVCPAQLLPQQLLAYSRSDQWDRLRQNGLADCIECGCCDLVCPSHIPLVETYRIAKSALRVRDREANFAAAARLRYEARAKRMQRAADDRALRQAGQQQATSASAVQAAIERAKSKHAVDADGQNPPS
ncbi:MAG: electron transport complex subunit RsxC [Pseudomarimonas sp.]